MTTPQASQTFAPETDRILRDAGWFPGRSVQTATWESSLNEHGGFVMHEAAREFLAEFGGLHVPELGKGIRVWRMMFTLDSTSGEWEEDVYNVLG